MKARRTLATLATGVTLAALAVAGLTAADTKVQKKDVPPMVQRAVEQEQARGATIVGLGKAVEGGKAITP